MIPLIVHGALGRMGRRVIDLAGEQDAFRLVAGIDRAGLAPPPNPPGAVPVVDSLDAALRLAPAGAGAGRVVVVDFSAPGAVEALAAACAGRGAALVSGTTGLAAADEAALDAAARSVPVVWAPNMSLGVNLLYRLVEAAGRALPAADVEITEAHHRHKLDAPSGTARRLAELVARARGGGAIRSGRSGVAEGERPAGEIGVHALRLGEVVGDHAVHFALAHEILTLSHHAQGRDVFASGALAAARYAATAAPGRYGMEAVLGF